jgi:hypothetical protein
VSGIGFARVELRAGDTYVEYELHCLETPETAGGCAAASVLAPRQLVGSSAGSGAVLRQAVYSETDQRAELRELLENSR